MIDLKHMDCLEYIKGLPDDAFDLAIVDPPYGISVNMNMGRKAGQPKKYEDKKWDDEIPPQEYFDHLLRVSKNQIIWGANHFPLPLTSSWIFWDKDLPEGLSFSDGELAWTSFGGALKKVRLPYGGGRGRDKVRIHPTQKPVALYKWLLKTYAKEGDRILDTHLGSGSIAIACHDLGLDLTACELDPDYFAKASKRLADHQSQLGMFGVAS